VTANGPPTQGFADAAQGFADTEVVTRLTRATLRAYATALTREPDRRVNTIDSLMAAVTFLRVVATDLSKRLDLNETETESFYVTVIRTLESALQREHQRRFTHPTKPKR